MMPIDASIPLQVQQPHFDDPLTQASKVYSLKSLMANAAMEPMKVEAARMSLQKEQQQVMDDRAVRSFYSDQNNFTQLPEGLVIPKPEALSRLASQAPTAAAGIQDKFAKQQEQFALAAKNKAEAQQKLNDEMGSHSYNLKQRIDADVKTMGLQAAMQKNMPAILESQKSLSPIAQAAGVPVQDLSQMDPQHLYQAIDNQALRWSKLQENQRQDRNVNSEIQNREELRKQGQQRIGMEAQRLGIERANLGLRQQEFEHKKSTEGGPSMSPENVDYWAGVIANGGSLPPGLARSKEGAALVSKVMQKVPQLAKDPNAMLGAQADFQGTKAAARTAGTRSANIEMAVNEASQFADLALQASDKVARTGFMPVNKALLAYQKNTGDPDTVAFGAATNSFINAYARAISPSGTPTVSDKEHAREMLENAQSKEQYQATIAQLKKEMAAAQKSPDVVKRDIRTGLSERSSEGSKRKVYNPSTGKFEMQ